MKFVSVRDLRLNPKKVWEQLDDEEVIITSNGKPVALLTGVRDATMEKEIAARRRARALLALDEIHEAVRRRPGPLPSKADLEREIRAVRRARR